MREQCARATTSKPTQEETPTTTKDEKTIKPGEALAAQALTMLDKDMADFIRKMVASGEDLGFLKA